MNTPAKVQELHPVATAFTVPLDKLDSYEGIKLVSRLLRKWERANTRMNTYRNLSKSIGVSATAIARIASEETKAPRLHTILMIMKGIGFSAVRFE